MADKQAKAAAAVAYLLHSNSGDIGVNAPEYDQKLLKSPKQHIYYWAAGVVFTVGLIVSLATWHNNDVLTDQILHAQAQAQDDEVQTGAVPTEKEPSSESIRAYQVAPDKPRYLKIPAINIYARVRKVGLKSSGELQAPASIFDTGWYEQSSKPGENGAIVIDGHVSGPTMPGVFSKIKDLKSGSIIEIERGDGTMFKYTVVNTQWYDADKVDMATVITSAVPGKPGLNLITCGGKYDAKKNRYQKRLAVFAVQL